MAQATYTVETSSSTIKELGRKAQAGVFKAVQGMTEEWGWLKDLTNYDVPISLREITHEADVIRGTGAAFINEGGKEARPSSPTAVTATVTPLLLNKRFTMSRTTQMVLSRQSSRAFLEDQFKFQGRKAAEAIHHKLGINFYGFSSGTQCKLNVISGAPDYTLKDLYGIADLGGTTHNRRCVDQFVVGTVASQNLDYVAALNPTGPAIRSIAGLTAKVRSTNTVTASAAFTADEISDLVVYANNVENTTMAAGTEEDLNLVGLLDGATSTSVHGISKSTYEMWDVGYSDTTAGRFTGMKLHRARQGIMNNGGGKADTVIWAQGVERDVVSQLQAGLRFSDAFGMEMDGEAKAKGISFKTSRLVPDGYVFVMDSKNSVRRLMLTPSLDMPDVGDGDKLQDDSGSIYSADFLVAMAWTNRGNMAYFSNQSQS